MARKSCKLGKVKSGPRKGMCRKRPVRGAAARAVACAGKKGESFRACISPRRDLVASQAMDGLRRRRRRYAR